MAEVKRGAIWLVCQVCKHQNYRKERRLKVDIRAEQAKADKREGRPPRGQNKFFRLELRKYCKHCRAQTVHTESRKK